MSFRATLPVPPQRTPLTVTGLSILSTVPILVGQLTGTGLDPLLAPISQYVHLPGGYALVLAGAALLAGCGLVLAHHLVQGAATDRGAARRVAVGLLVSYGVAMILVGLVPTDPPDATTPSAAELVHRTCVSWAFVALPLAGLVAAHVPRRRVVLARCSAALLGLLLVFGAIQLPLLAAGSGIPILGVVERIGFVVMIGYLILLAIALRGHGRQTTPDAG